MRLLAPHFRRAVHIGKTIDLKTVEAAALADAEEPSPARGRTNKRHGSWLCWRKKSF